MTGRPARKGMRGGARRRKWAHLSPPNDGLDDLIEQVVKKAVGAEEEDVPLGDGDHKELEAAGEERKNGRTGREEPLAPGKRERRREGTGEPPSPPGDSPRRIHIVISIISRAARSGLPPHIGLRGRVVVGTVASELIGH